MQELAADTMISLDCTGFVTLNLWLGLYNPRSHNITIFYSVLDIVRYSLLGAPPSTWIDPLSCNFTVSVASCTSSEWRCNDGQCIPSSYPCDGEVPDCTDGSDELNCCKYSKLWVLYISLLSNENELLEM